MSHDLQHTIDTLSGLMHKRMEQFESAVIPAMVGANNTAPPAPADLAAVYAEFTHFKQLVLNLLEVLRAQVEANTTAIDDMEMRSRRKILIFHGVTEIQDENVGDVLAELIRSKLKLTDVTETSFKAIHRMGAASQTEGHTRPILVRFREATTKADIWSKKSFLKGSNVSESEFLTKTRQSIFLKARKCFGVRRCWSRDGKIFIMAPDNIRHRICSESEFNALVNKFPPNTDIAKRSARVPSAKQKTSATASGTPPAPPMVRPTTAGQGSRAVDVPALGISKINKPGVTVSVPRAAPPALDRKLRSTN